MNLSPGEESSQQEAKHNSACDQPGSHLGIKKTHEARSRFGDLDHSGRNRLNHAAATAADRIVRI